MTEPTLRAPGWMGAAFAAVGALLALYFVADAWGDRDRVEETTLQLMRELEEKHRKASHHAAFRTQFLEERELLAHLVQRLPSHFDPPAMEKNLRDLATQSGVEIVALPFEKESIKEFYGEMGASVVLQGSLPAITIFLDGFARQNPLRSVALVKLERANDTGILRASVIVAYYRYMEDDP